ncbi:MAG: phosphate ABC transporter permease subunit PstC [Solirubrobacteraceae bacterium]
MSTTSASAPLSSGRHFADRLGDRLLLGVTACASLVTIALIVLIIVKLFSGASVSISHFGLGFLWNTIWNPAQSVGVAHPDTFGAGVLIYGTVVSSLIALLIAVPLGVAIGVFLSLLASRRATAVIGPLVELLAAIPSVILGFWGIIVLAPFLRSTVEPALHDVLGFIPLFGSASATGLGLFTAGVVLAIMVLPIIASISRDLFATVPPELKDGALALGATRWEMIRAVVLDSTRAGLASATILGLSRALGEAIAVTQCIGAGNAIVTSLFTPSDTLASRIAENFPTAGGTGLWHSSLFYCAVVLLVMELIVNLVAQLIVRRSQLPAGIR